MLGRNEIRLLMLHEFKLGRSVTEATDNIKKAWGEDVTTDRTVRRWFTGFHRGEERVTDVERNGRPNLVSNEVLRERVEANPSLTVRKMSQGLNVAPSTTWRHLKAINKVKKLNKWVPHELSASQRLKRMEATRPHVSRVTTQKLNQLGYESLPHPPYSPDLSPTDYHLFFHLNVFVRGKIFGEQKDAENAFRAFVVSKEPLFYSNGINKLVSRWQRCVEAEGAYFE